MSKLVGTTGPNKGCF